MNRVAIQDIVSSVLECTEFSDNNRPVKMWPKRKFNQTLEQYASEQGVSVSEVPVLGHDEFTSQTNYKGFGWC